MKVSQSLFCVLGFESSVYFNEILRDREEKTLILLVKLFLKPPVVQIDTLALELFKNEMLVMNRFIWLDWFELAKTEYGLGGYRASQEVQQLNWKSMILVRAYEWIALKIERRKRLMQ